MCNQITLDQITSKVTQTAKNSLGNKLEKVILYGSYARGDYDDESDIDIMVLANIPAEDKWKVYMSHFNELASRLGLEKDVLISIHVQDIFTFNKYADYLPFYIRVAKEGVVLGA